MLSRLLNNSELKADTSHKTIVYKKQTEKHLSIFAEFYENSVCEISKTQSAPLVLAGYRPGRPPAYGVLVLQGNVLAFCQKTRFRKSITELSLNRISAFTVSKLMKLTVINLHMPGFQFDFNTTAPPETLNAFLREIGAQKPCG